MTTEDTTIILSVAEVLITLYVEIDDWYRAWGSKLIPLRPGPKPRFTDLLAGWEQLDTTPLPVKHPSRVRGPDWWVGPPGSDLVAGFGLCAAKGKHAWF